MLLVWPALTIGWLLLLVQIVLLCACLVRRVRHLAPLDVRMLSSLSLFSGVEASVLIATFLSPQTWASLFWSH